MDGGGHDIATVEDLFHHHRMEGGEVSPGALVAGSNLLVDGGEERAGAAGKVADAEAADGIGVSPVHLVTGSLQLGDGQPGEKGGRLGAGVEGGEVFAVCDKPLEDPPGQVVGVGDAGGLHLLGSVTQHGQDLAGVAGVELAEDVPGDGEDGPVVDFQDGCPRAQGLGLGIGNFGAADEVEGFIPSCFPAMRSWKTRALAMIAQAIRRVWGTLDIPRRRDISPAAAGARSLSSSRITAAFSMPSCRVSAARSTSFWGTETSRTRSPGR